MQMEQRGLPAGNYIPAYEYRAPAGPHLYTQLHLRDVQIIHAGMI